MILSARFLTSVNSVNEFSYTPYAEFVEGDTLDLYFQLIDASKDTVEAGFYPQGRRYVAADGATLQVTIDNINDARKVIRFATQPFPGDKSIWKIQILATDVIRGTAGMRLSLSESGGFRKGYVQGAFRVQLAGVV